MLCRRCRNCQVQRGMVQHSARSQVLGPSFVFSPLSLCPAGTWTRLSGQRLAVHKEEYRIRGKFAAEAGPGLGEEILPGSWQQRRHCQSHWIGDQGIPRGRSFLPLSIAPSAISERHLIAPSVDFPGALWWRSGGEGDSAASPVGACLLTDQRVRGLRLSQPVPLCRSFPISFIWQREAGAA